MTCQQMIISTALPSTELFSSQYPHELHPGTLLRPGRCCLKSSAAMMESLHLDNDEKLHPHLVIKQQNVLDDPREVPSSDNITPSKDVSQRILKKEVSFNTIEIKQYERLPGDNPSVSCGVPLSLGWEVVDTQIVSVDEYEAQLGVTRIPRTKQELALGHEERKTLLQESWGYSDKAITDASNLSRDFKIKRIQTLIRLRKPQVVFLEEIIEKSARRINSLRSTNKQEIKKLLIQTKERNALIESENFDRRSSDPGPLPEKFEDAVLRHFSV